MTGTNDYGSINGDRGCENGECVASTLNFGLVGSAHVGFSPNTDWLHRFELLQFCKSKSNLSQISAKLNSNFPARLIRLILNFLYNQSIGIVDSTRKKFLPKPVSQTWKWRVVMYPQTTFAAVRCLKSDSKRQNEMPLRRILSAYEYKTIWNDKRELIPDWTGFLRNLRTVKCTEHHHPLTGQLNTRGTCGSWRNSRSGG